MVLQEQPSRTCLNGCKQEDEYDESWYDKLLFALWAEEKSVTLQRILLLQWSDYKKAAEMHYVF